MTTERVVRRGGRGGIGRIDVALGAAIVFAAVVLPMMLTSHYGALDIPRSDDWSYLRTLFGWHETGEWNFNDWVSMTLVGQVYISAPVVAAFGDSIAAVRFLVAALGAIGLLATYSLARTVGVARGIAALVALSVALGPLWGPLATSYMTDVPSFAFQAIAVACVAIAVARGPFRLGWVVAALAAGVGAVSVRQYAIVTLLAVATTGVVVVQRDHRRRVGPAVWVAVGLAGLAVIGILVWWSGVPQRLALEPRPPNGAALRLAFTSLGGFLRLAALLQAPVVVAVGPVRLVRAAAAASSRLTAVVATLTAAVLATSWALSPDVLYVGNYLDRRGTLGDVIIHGNRPDLMPRVVFDLMAFGASLLALALVIATVPWLVRARDQGARATFARVRQETNGTDLLVALSLIGLLAAYELAILARLPIFDRYALSGIPLVGIAIARRGRTLATDEPDARSLRPGEQPLGIHSARVGFAVSSLAVVGLAVVGAAYTADSAAFDAGRWRAAEAAVAAGLEPRDIDAGYEWNGWHRGVAPGVRPSIEERKRLRQEYVKGLCAQVVVEPNRVPKRAIAVVDIPGWFRDPARLYVLPTGKACASGTDIAGVVAARERR